MNKRGIINNGNIKVNADLVQTTPITNYFEFNGTQGVESMDLRIMSFNQD